MNVGVSELYAINMFTRLNYEIANFVTELYSARLTDQEKIEYNDLIIAYKSMDVYINNNIPFGDDHIELLQKIDKFIKRRRKKSLPT